VAQLLESKVKINERGGLSREVRPGDIAIFARSNDACRELADALTAQGLAVSYSSGTLLEQPEVVIALAGYGFVVDSRDRLAAAELLPGARHSS
jgi:ATP-dependent exoDNAse (exonuclease V) beta subunit